jgi:protein SCO1/2
LLEECVRSLIALVFVAGLLAACGTDADAETAEFSGTQLDHPYEVIDVGLTDTSGAPYSLLHDREKPLTLVFFGYTNCPDFCPLVMGNIASGLNRLDAADRAQVDMVFVTTDPERDDEQQLRTYLDNYDSGFIGLTGDLDEITRLAAPLHIYVSEGEELPSGGRDLGGHTTWTLAIDDSDRAVALWRQTTSAPEYAADIHSLLND